MKRVLLALPDASEAVVAQRAFGRGYDFDLARTPAELAAKTGPGRVDVVFLDLACLGADCAAPDECRAALAAIWAGNPHADIVVLGESGRIRSLVNMVRAGAADYLTYPLDETAVGHVLDGIRAAREMRHELLYLRSQATAVDVQHFLSLPSPAMQEVYRKVRAVADTKALVLLLGETGVGKGVVARLIHRLSHRADGPFISVHCGSIPESLFESELFGHERGAFTGADRQKPGRLELAAKGTVFLDEVGTMTDAMQVKLLHFLQDKCFQRVGGCRDIPLDCRIIAATNQDLEALSRRGEFRPDLYYRLNVFPITIAPLRERPADIPALALHFLEQFNRRHGKRIQGLDPAVGRALSAYPWPGNVRELENLLERAYLLETTPIIRPGAFPADFFRPAGPDGEDELDLERPLEAIKRAAVERLERRYLTALLVRYGGRMDRTARHAGLSTRHLRTLVHKYGIDRAACKPPAR